MRWNVLALTALTATAVLADRNAKADVIFSTNATTTPTFYPANGSTSTSSVFHAFQFTVAPGDGGVLGTLVTAGAFFGSSNFSETFEILSNASGTLGSVLDTLSVTGSADSVGRLYTASSTTHVELVAGVSYWLAALSPGGSNEFLWLEADPVVSAREYSSVSGYFDGQPSAAFALVTKAPESVPEPATLYLIGSGLAALGIARRRHSAPA